MMYTLLMLFALSGSGLHAMEKMIEGPETVETEILKTMQEVNSFLGRSNVLASHISMAKSINHFPSVETHFHTAKSNIQKGIATLSMPQEDPTREAKLLENLAQLRQSKDNLSPIVKKMENMVKKKICKQALSYQVAAEQTVQTAQTLIDHINNAPIKIKIIIKDLTMRSMMLLSFTFLPIMGFQPSKRFIAFVSTQTYPKHQKQLPARLQDVSIKNQAEQTKINAQKFKAKERSQQKKPKTNG